MFSFSKIQLAPLNQKWILKNSNFWPKYRREENHEPKLKWKLQEYLENQTF